MPFLKLEGRETVSLYFEDYGLGQPVVVLHGWPHGFNVSHAEAFNRSLLGFVRS